MKGSELAPLSFMRIMSASLSSTNPDETLVSEIKFAGDASLIKIDNYNLMNNTMFLVKPFN